jgi:hypothetical protein
MARTIRHLVVDGSNIATESRTLPSLAQLDEAVRAVQAEDPDRQVTVIVDATFAHRIDSSERKTFEEANDAGEIIMPPAGAVGRGDAFILQVAEKADAAVLSNDSFQEFHGEHPWLFEEGRLIGGKPVGDVGWVFVDRVPVRGPASRRATRGSRDTKKSSRSSGSGRSKKTASRSAQGPPPKPSASNPPPGPKERRSKPADQSSDRRKGQRRTTEDAGKKASTSKKTAAKSKNDSRKSQGKNKYEALNSPHEFMLFVTQHSIGDEVSGVVERFSSHGCYLRASSAQCYLPSSEMGDPPPTRARDVVALGQTIIVKVESLDSDRRGINVVLVRTVADDGTKQGKPNAGNSRGNKVSKTSQQQASVADESAREANLTRSTTIVATKKSAKKARKKPAAKKATAKKAAKATSSARATKAAKRRTAAKKRPAAKKTAKKAAKKTTKKAAAKKRPAAKKAAKKTTKKAAAKKTAKKVAKKRPAAKKAAKKTAKKAAKKKR